MLRSDLPQGSGLASSAALELASALALSGGDGTAGRSDDARTHCSARRERIRRRSCGLMDQFASAFGREGERAAARLPIARAPRGPAPARRRGARRVPTRARRAGSRPRPTTSAGRSARPPSPRSPSGDPDGHSAARRDAGDARRRPRRPRSALAARGRAISSTRTIAYSEAVDAFERRGLRRPSDACSTRAMPRCATCSR